MPPSEPLRVFISYARKDGATLAQRLQYDLKKQGFDAWLDKQRIQGGASWTTSIEHALDRAEHVLALMTAGSYVSEICRAEQLRALRKGKCVIPLLAQANCDIPLYLEAKNYRDFSSGGMYGSSFDALLRDISESSGVVLKDQYRHTSYVTVPPLPNNYIKRPEAITSLRTALITDDGGVNVALTALQGMGGIGKTILAQALCRDEVIQQAFPDGIIWTSVGKEPTFDLLTRLREVGKALGDDLTRYDSELGSKNQYRSTIFGKAVLVVVDDVWRANDLEPFLAEGTPRSRVLFTTRDTRIAAEVGAREQVADLLSEGQSREVLARWSNNSSAALPPEAANVIEACGRLPLALSMIGAMLRGKPPAMWVRVLELLHKAELEKVKAEFPGYPYLSVFAATKASVDALDGPKKEHYLELAVLPEDMPAAPKIQQCLWGVSEGEALETAEEFVSLSLAQRDKPEGSIRLHDLQFDYVRAQYHDKEALELIHGAVRLSMHVVAQDSDQQDPAGLLIKQDGAAQFASQLIGRLLPHRSLPEIERLISGVAQGAPRPWLRPLEPALQSPGTGVIRTLSGHVGFVQGVAISRDGRWAISTALYGAPKVWDVERGRELRTLSHPAILWGVAMSANGRLSISTSYEGTLYLWDTQSGPELRAFVGRSGPVSRVAISADGRLAAFGSSNEVKVWDVETGCELRTLQGHTSDVNGVALSGDGRHAVSASRDQTLKVWEVETGRELRTLQGHTSDVNSVALSGDGRYAVSASRDQTLKVWEVETGRELRTLVGHSYSVDDVAVSSDGRRAISASFDELKVWDVKSGRELHTLEGGRKCVALSGDGRRAISAGRDYTVKVWDLESVREVQPKRHYHSGMAISAGGRWAVSSSTRDHTLYVWDMEIRHEVRTLVGHSEGVTGVAVSAYGRVAVSASYDKTLKVWDVASGRELRSLGGHSNWVNGVALSGDGRRAVSASEDTTLKVWDVESGREVRTLIGHSGSVRDVALSGDGRRAVSASEDTTLKVWDVESGRELRTLFNQWAVPRVAISGDGRWAVSSTDEWSGMTVWDVENGCEIREIRGHIDDVTDVAMSGDGRWVVSASKGKTSKVWAVDSGSLVATFTCDDRASFCAIADHTVIVGDVGGRVHFLSLEE